MNVKFEAVTFGVNHTTHKTSDLARKALAKHRREIRSAHPGFAGPWPIQQIIRVADGQKTVMEQSPQ